MVMKMSKKLLGISILFYSLTAFAQTKADQKTYLQNVMTQMKMKWPANRMIHIVVHGHSVPAGYFKTPEVDTFNAYPHLLHKALKKQYPHAVINVTVTAIGGENSENGAKRFERDVLSIKPDLVLIDYALNDRSVGLLKSQIAWTKMIKAAKAKGIKVLLLTPTADKRAKLTDPLDPLNRHAEQVRALAKEHSVGLVDSYAVFKKYVALGNDLNDLMSQINHPNRQGHDLVVLELMKWFPVK